MEGDNVSRKEFDQLQTQLSQTVALAEENNRLLRNMRKWGRIAFWFKVLIWALVLIAPVLLYPYIASYVKAIPGLSGITNTSTSTNSSLFGLPSPAAVVEFIHPGK